jgi:acyl-CoA thioesterase FadM
MRRQPAERQEARAEDRVLAVEWQEARAGGRELVVEWQAARAGDRELVVEWQAAWVPVLLGRREAVWAEQQVLLKVPDWQRAD